MVISLPVNRDLPRGIASSRPARPDRGGCTRQLGSALAYAEWVLERIDPTQRLTHVAVAASISGAGYFAWRTQGEHDASPNSISMGMSSGQEKEPVTAGRPRAALRLDRTCLVEDLVVLLRRQMTSRI